PAPTKPQSSSSWPSGDVSALDWYSDGRLVAGVSASAAGVDLPNLRGSARGLIARGIDKDRQEDARSIAFAAGSSLTVTGPQGNSAWRIVYSVDAKPEGKVAVTSGDKSFDITHPMQVAEGKGWREMVLTSACVDVNTTSLSISADAPFELKISAILREDAPDGTQCSF
ncbi:MAG: putative glycoside hydrolase, partial [Pseudomonadota bacterium]